MLDKNVKLKINSFNQVFLLLTVTRFIVCFEHYFKTQTKVSIMCYHYTTIYTTNKSRQIKLFSTSINWYQLKFSKRLSMPPYTFMDLFCTLLNWNKEVVTPRQSSHLFAWNHIYTTIGNICDFVWNKSVAISCRQHYSVCFSTGSEVCCTFLLTTNAIFYIPEISALPKLRVNDIFNIQQAFIQTHLRHMNNSRLYLQVLMLCNTCNTYRIRILNDILQSNKANLTKLRCLRILILKWPRQTYPSSEAWTIWSLF